MPIRVRYKDDPSQECTIRPTPLVNISTQILRTSAGKPFGVTYQITLTGTLLADQGSPYARDNQTDSIFPFYGAAPSLAGPYFAFDTNVSHVDGNKPPKQQIPVEKAASAIITKQRALRGLFARDGQRVEITDFTQDRSSLVFYPRLIDMSFSEGVWVDRCDFTMTFEADTLLYGEGGNELVDNDSSIVSDGLVKFGVVEEELINDLLSVEGFITDYTDDWDVNIDRNFGKDTDNPVSYTFSHTVSATGKNHWGPNGEQEPWKEARRFVKGRLATNGVYDYPNIEFPLGWDGSQPVQFAPGTIDLLCFLTGYNYTINETINETTGSYSISETWTVTPTANAEDDDEDDDKASESWSTTTTISNGSPYVSVSVDGSIKGMSEGTRNGIKVDADNDYSALENAMAKWHKISNNAQMGIKSAIFKRLNSLVAVELNAQPISLTVSQSPFGGELSYQAEFNNRPTNYVTGSLTESISLNDTYPGDVFAVIPVIGRETGPVLQNIGGRTEYRRDLSINLTMDYTRIPYAYEGVDDGLASTRSPLMLKKPSVLEPSASEIANLIYEMSPFHEPGVRKYFANPPSESWDAKTGSYSFNISWIYEINK